MEHPRISRDPKIMVGKPCIRGTRLTVEHVLRGLSHGASFDDMIAAYPRLTHADILAAISYAADYIGHESLIAA